MLLFTEDEFKIPVCIADLPAHDFQVSPDTLTENVVAVLEEKPDLPGVLIIEKRALVGFITRLKLFERLGHRYGIELFMRKPIRELQRAMRTQVEPLPGNLRVDEAVRRALQRPALDIYDPVVVELKKNHMYRILNMNVLVLAQSRAVTNLSNVVGKLGQIDALLHKDMDKAEIMTQILHLIGQVVPYHQAHVLVREGKHLKLVAALGVPHNTATDWSNLQSNLIYKMLLEHRQAISLPDTRHVPAWQGMEALGQPISWLGVPLLEDEKHFWGLLSLGRNVASPFNLDEKQTCQAFSQRILTVLRQQEKKNIFCAPAELFSQGEMLTFSGVEVC